MSRSRSWCFTINNPTFEDLFNFHYMDARYKIFGFEEGDKGTLHMQGYAFFENALRLSTLKGKLPRAHLEVAKGTPQQASDYCKKDGDYTEIGCVPVQGKISFQDIENVMANPESNFPLFHQYRRSYKEYKTFQNKSKVKERRLEAIPKSMLYLFCKLYPPTDVFMYDGKMDVYEDEPVMVILNGFDVIDYPIDRWLNGYPPKIRRGYDVVVVDPTVIYTVYSTAEEYNNLVTKHIDDYIKVWREGDIPSLHQDHQE